MLHYVRCDIQRRFIPLAPPDKSRRSRCARLSLQSALAVLTLGARHSSARLAALAAFAALATFTLPWDSLNALFALHALFAIRGQHSPLRGKRFGTSVGFDADIGRTTVGHSIVQRVGLAFIPLTCPVDDAGANLALDALHAARAGRTVTRTAGVIELRHGYIAIQATS